MIAIDPLLNLIKQYLKPLEIVCAFADDLAAALSSLQSLNAIARAFKVFKKISNLGIKASKCCIVPLGARLSLQRVENIRNHLRAHLPDWAEFNIDDAAKYLGFHLGPGSAAPMWKAPHDKFSKRAYQIAGSKLAPSLSIQQYNQRAMSVLQYIAQIYPIDPAILKNERHYLQKQVHVLNYTFPINLMLRFGEVIGATQPISMRALSYAARFRAARITAGSWREWKTVLDTVRDDHAPLGWLSGEAHSNPWWTTPPVADLMHEAFHGFPNEVSGLANCLIDAPAVAVKKKLQGRIMPLILAELYPIDPVQLLLSRLALWLPPACLSELEAFQLQDSMKAIRTNFTSTHALCRFEDLVQRMDHRCTGGAVRSPVHFLCMSKRRVVPYYLLPAAVGARPECAAPPETYVCFVKSVFRASRRRLQKSFNSFVRSFRYISWT